MIFQSLVLEAIFSYVSLGEGRFHLGYRSILLAVEVFFVTAFACQWFSIFIPFNDHDSTIAFFHSHGRLALFSERKRRTGKLRFMAQDDIVVDSSIISYYHIDCIHSSNESESTTLVTNHELCQDESLRTDVCSLLTRRYVIQVLIFKNKGRSP